MDDLIELLAKLFAAIAVPIIGLIIIVHYLGIALRWLRYFLADNWPYLLAGGGAIAVAIAVALLLNLWVRQLLSVWAVRRLNRQAMRTLDEQYRAAVLQVDRVAMEHGRAPRPPDLDGDIVAGQSQIEGGQQ
ncbi:hypothetical protein AB0J55_44885 [Amycolatopsis sp. NPDC049688]|uniref:hypothetical protein n=1 Tax=Amycolatopsis sp. NPDC049688 TaxID=3154733 RepID=UPI00341DFBF8